MAKVQIDAELFNDLCAYFFLGEGDRVGDIERALEAKLNALVKHQLYTRAKTAPTDAEREEARRAYLDKVGMKKDFRY